MSHPRPWKIVYAKTFTGNGTYPIYLISADGRKICSIWGREDGEKEETANIIMRAVNAYDKVMQKRTKDRNNERPSDSQT